MGEKSEFVSVQHGAAVVVYERYPIEAATVIVPQHEVDIFPPQRGSEPAPGTGIRRGRTPRASSNSTLAATLRKLYEKVFGAVEKPLPHRTVRRGRRSGRKIAGFLDKIVQANPDDKVLDPYRVSPDGTMQEQAPGKFQPLDLNRLDWNEVIPVSILISVVLPAPSGPRKPKMDF